MGSRNTSFQEGGFTSALLAPLKLIFVLTLVFVGILVAAWILDWLFVFKIWPDGIVRLQGILVEDLSHARELAAWQGGVPGAVTGTGNLLYGLVFRVTGIHDMGIRFSDGAALSIPDTIVRNTYLVNIEAIEVAMIGTQLLGVRLAMLALLTPILVLIYIVAGADGLTQRAIRRASGGRESASLYHRAKHLQVAVLTMGTLGMLLWPSSFDPLLIGVPLVAAVGSFARLQWSYYKKHL